MLSNKYPGSCDRCGEAVAAGAGFAVKLWGRNMPTIAMRDGSGRRRRVGNGGDVVWRVRCPTCAPAAAPSSPTGDSEGRAYAAGYAYACGYHD